MISFFKLVGPFLLTGLIATSARADIFAIKTEKDFSTCLETDHLVVTKGEKEKQSKYMSELDIQMRCLKEASKRLSKEKDPKVIAKWIEIANTRTHRDNTIDLIGLRVKLDKKACNEKDVYERIMSIMAMPSNKDEESLFQRGWKVIRTCLADKQFKEDFMDEQESSKTSYQYKNVCEVLMGEKLIKKCK